MSDLILISSRQTAMASSNIDSLSTLISMFDSNGTVQTTFNLGFEVVFTSVADQNGIMDPDGRDSCTDKKLNERAEECPWQSNPAGRYLLEA